jgi:arsenate reductase
VEYLKSPPSAPELQGVIALLGIRPEALVRKGEEIFKSKYAGRTLTDAEWIAAMVEDPVLIERPVVIAGGKAVIGRPPARALEIIGA